MSNWAKKNNENRKIWDSNANFWDERMGEGNLTHRLLIAPATEKLLALKPGEEVLDIACGNGQFARRLAELKAQVVAFDFSRQLVEKAKRKSKRAAGKIDYQVIDATDEKRLLALGAERFDAAVCTMALMDMAQIEPLLRALRKLLKKNGRFVFTVLHPCFNAEGITKLAEERYCNGKFVIAYSVKTTKYITPSCEKGLAMSGQPAPQYYFQRPLQTLLGTCFQAGFVMDGIEEPAFGKEIKSEHFLSFDGNFSEIPLIIAVRLRLK